MRSTPDTTELLIADAFHMNLHLERLATRAQITRSEDIYRDIAGVNQIEPSRRLTPKSDTARAVDDPWLNHKADSQ